MIFLCMQHICVRCIVPGPARDLAAGAVLCLPRSFAVFPAAFRDPKKPLPQWERLQNATLRTLAAVPASASFAAHWARVLSMNAARAVLWSSSPAQHDFSFEKRPCVDAIRSAGPAGAREFRPGSTIPSRRRCTRGSIFRMVKSSRLTPKKTRVLTWRCNCIRFIAQPKTHMFLKPW